MKMDNKKDIIEFEDLFKEEIEKRNEPPKPDNIMKYINTIITYTVIMFLLGGVIFLMIQGIPEANKTYTKDELILENIAADTSGVGLMTPIMFDTYDQNYSGYVDALYTYQGYEIIYNTSNPYIEDLLLVKDNQNNVIGINEQVFLSIYDGTENQINYWDQESTLEINRYQHNEQSLPDFLVTTDINMIENEATGITSFYSALYQFALYAILLASILVFMKNDIVYDFNQFKTVKNQWFVILATGYLYVILANYLSSFLSNLLSSSLNIPVSESVNQMTIVRMLNSNGVVFIVLSAVLIGPIVEELVFRKSIFGLIKNNTIAIAVSSIIFGAIHLTAEASIAEALINGISYFAMGLVFGYIYIKNNRNIIAPIAVHILVNLISVIGSILLF
jgi:membrane protease YdiL (CAAX protease family)